MLKQNILQYNLKIAVLLGDSIPWVENQLVPGRKNVEEEEEGFHKLFF